MGGSDYKTRIDQLLVVRGLCASREQAQRAIMAGRVTIGGHKAEKPGLQVSRDAHMWKSRVSQRDVGRGGFKLEAALKHFQISRSKQRSALMWDPRRAVSLIAFCSAAQQRSMRLMSDAGSSLGD